MRPLRKVKTRSGSVLLVVLIVVMVVCVISLGFITSSRVQMACGQNMATRMQMDYLADSGLVRAKTLLLNPQGLKVSTSPNGYWQGETGYQLEAGGDDYYDITVSRSVLGPTNRCTYDITCQAYRLQGVDRLAESTLNARLRLDPCIAYWAGASGNIGGSVTVNGDVYCNGNVTITGTVAGDVFAATVVGAKTGQFYSGTPQGVTFPDIGVGFFSPVYDYGGILYTPVILASPDCNSPAPFSPDGSNPAGIVYRSGNLRLMGDVTIDGTLVVDGNLTIQGPGNVVITSVKNFPGLVVAGTVTIEKSSNVTVNGLVQTNAMSVAGDAGNVNILGALFVRNSSLNVDPLYSGSVTIDIAPMISAVKLSSQGGSVIKWSPAGGAFFKKISRN